MLKIEFDETLDHPRDLVFEVLRDRLTEYTKHVPNLTYVKVLDRKKIGADKLQMRAEWMGHGQIPLLVRAILRPDMIKWKDVSVWDSKKYTCSWEIEPYFFKEYFKCKGQWKLHEEGKNETRIEMDGTLHIDIPHFPGVPDRIAQGAGVLIEKFIMRYLEPNLRENYKAVQKFLALESKKKNHAKAKH